MNQAKLIEFYEEQIENVSNNYIKDKKRFKEKLQDSGFYIAPSSRFMHCSYPGGLAEHCSNVYFALELICKEFNLDLSKDQKVIMGLFHDLDKVGNYKQKVDKDGKTSYESNPKLFHHGTNSVLILYKFGATLDDVIEESIANHMGGWDPNYREYSAKDIFKTKNYKAIQALHIADMMATHLMEYK